MATTNSSSGVSKTGKILVLPGDHIGPEVVTEALKVLDIIEEFTGARFEREFDLCGGASLDKHKDSVTEEVLSKCEKVDAVFFGSAGGPEWGTVQPNPESGLLRIRQRMEIFANLRPCNFASKALIERSPIKAEVISGVDFVLIRENCGGAYFGHKIEEADYGCDPWEYRRPEIERVARVAGALAMQHDPPLPVWSADKANVLASSRVWRRIVHEIFEKEFPKVLVRDQLADSLAMLLITKPTAFNGIILTDNTFGDILSDEAGGLTGSLGLLPSASLAGAPPSPATQGNQLGRNSVGGVRGLYEPVHGSAPDISGKGLANPVAQVLSLALMLRYSFNMHREAEVVEKAVQKVLDNKTDGGLEVRTGDLGGKAGTKEMSEAIQSEVRRLLQT
ncbi:Isopropylmalate dehydrogenase-like [Teratosphaeria destructans]|uniref:3-isopropylmalate dehydrogenase n=1 Tax=Teratosphaeria destructans TaxID=418781 RepID=A0A9W7SJS7_9PEZI|nr:Isopropylmalate dehydrogenase-like [Teratosphaeria destructans]